ncbi:MAG TPA: TetR/AcrR family transcriptional regulator [Bacillota bacterium]|nr:TetR/AcrR family transcriptional regulator [Bacillota bacterium]
MARPKEFDRNTALLKAMQVFWAKGFEGASMSDLTETMGISRSSLYETFGDKEDLFLEALNFYMQDIDRRRMATFTRTGSVKQGMKDFLYGAVKFVLNEEQPGGCFLTNTATALGTLDPHFQEMIRRHLEKQEEEFYLLLEQGVKSGEISPEKNPRELARFFVGLIRGVTVVARIHKDRKLLEDIVNVGLKAMD